jgi:hypothetical protein
VGGPPFPTAACPSGCNVRSARILLLPLSDGIPVAFWFFATGTLHVGKTNFVGVSRGTTKGFGSLMAKSRTASAKNRWEYDTLYRLDVCIMLCKPFSFVVDLLFAS